jgi:hypothetical protein
LIIVIIVHYKRSWRAAVSLIFQLNLQLPLRHI